MTAIHFSLILSDFSFNSPDFYQPVLDQLKAQVLILRRLVLGEGVVHVKPIELDLLQSEGTVDKNPEKRTCYLLCERYVLILILGCKVMPAIGIIKMPLMIGRLQHLQTRNQVSWQIIPLNSDSLNQNLYYSILQVVRSPTQESSAEKSNVQGPHLCG